VTNTLILSTMAMAQLLLTCELGAAELFKWVPARESQKGRWYAQNETQADVGNRISTVNGTLGARVSADNEWFTFDPLPPQGGQRVCGIDGIYVPGHQDFEKYINPKSLTIECDIKLTRCPDNTSEDICLVVKGVPAKSLSFGLYLHNIGTPQQPQLQLRFSCYNSRVRSDSDCFSEITTIALKQDSRIKVDVVGEGVNPLKVKFLVDGRKVRVLRELVGIVMLEPSPREPLIIGSDEPLFGSRFIGQIRWLSLSD
jgi:hypothetical protein